MNRETVIEILLKMKKVKKKDYGINRNKNMTDDNRERKKIITSEKLL